MSSTNKMSLDFLLVVIDNLYWVCKAKDPKLIPVEQRVL